MELDISIKMLYTNFLELTQIEFKQGKQPHARPPVEDPFG